MNQSSKSIDKDYNDLIELSEEIDELKREKLESLEKQKSERNQSSKDSKSLTGIISEIENNNRYINIIVTYTLGGVKQEKEFSLKKPQNSDEFNTDNKFVRLMNFFGDRKNDPSSLKYRNIWLKKENNDVQLHIPKDLSLTSITSEKIKRKLWKYGSINLGNVLKNSISALFAMSIIISLFTLTSITSTYGLTPMIALSLAGAMFLGLYFVVSVFVSIINPEFIFNKLFAMLAIATFLASTLYITGVFDLNYIIEYNSNSAVAIRGPSHHTWYKSLYNLLVVTTPLYLPLYFIFQFEEYIIETKSDLMEKYSDIKSQIVQKYQYMKGIEYIK